ncbi:MAG: bifunctional oligoribonuclease/PAP phosphatase NrnA [Clostridiales bacterium]
MLNNQKNLLLVGHLNPDGDCLGSLLALYLAFDGVHKGWQVATMDAFPAYLDFLPGHEIVRQPAQIGGRPEAVLFVDCCALTRTGMWLEQYLTANVAVYCIDHHQSADFQGQISLIEPTAAATGELVCALTEQAGIGFDRNIATNLYTVLVADTGCFRFTSTNARTLSQAALLRPWVDTAQIQIKLFENRSLVNMRLLSRVLARLQYLAEGQLCVGYLTREDFMVAGGEDANDIVNFTLYTSGVKIGLLVEEYVDFVKVSFRSHSSYRVDQLAQSLGGGGHLRAAGCRLPGTLREQLPRVVAAAEALIRQGENDE